MSKKIVYECAKCDCVAILYMRDGQCCPHCGGYMNAIREAKLDEFIGVQREPLVKKTATISEKLEYLDRLVRMLEANKAEHERIIAVCDSIEKDLGLKQKEQPGIISFSHPVDKGLLDKIKKAFKGEYVGNITVPGTVNLSGLVDEWHVGKQPDE